MLVKVSSFNNGNFLRGKIDIVQESKPCTTMFRVYNWFGTLISGISAAASIDKREECKMCFLVLILCQIQNLSCLSADNRFLQRSCMEDCQSNFNGSFKGVDFDWRIVFLKTKSVNWFCNPSENTTYFLCENVYSDSVAALGSNTYQNIAAFHKTRWMFLRFKTEIALSLQLILIVCLSADIWVRHASVLQLNYKRWRLVVTWVAPLILIV